MKKRVVFLIMYLASKNQKIMTRDYHQATRREERM